MGTRRFPNQPLRKEAYKMTRSELQLRVENLEALYDEILALLDDPDIGEGELRDQLRGLLEEDHDDQ